MPTSVVNAATITVTTLDDEDDGTADPNNGAGTSLREAVNHSNAGDSIAFTDGLIGTISLDPSLGEVTINNSLTLTGPGATML